MPDSLWPWAPLDYKRHKNQWFWLCLVALARCEAEGYDVVREAAYDQWSLAMRFRLLMDCFKLVIVGYVPDDVDHPFRIDYRTSTEGGVYVRSPERHRRVLEARLAET
jgi:hypothetical protein